MMREILAAVLSSPDFLLLALILAIGVLFYGAKMLWKSLDWLEKTLRSSRGRLMALATLAFCVALGAETSGATAGHFVALSLTMCAWMLWRRSEAFS